MILHLISVHACLLPVRGWNWKVLWDDACVCVSPDRVCWELCVGVTLPSSSCLRGWFSPKPNEESHTESSLFSLVSYWFIYKHKHRFPNCLPLKISNKTKKIKIVSMFLSSVWVHICILVGHDARAFHLTAFICMENRDVHLSISPSSWLYHCCLSNELRFTSCLTFFILLSKPIWR